MAAQSGNTGGDRGALRDALLGSLFGDRAAEYRESMLLARTQAFWPDLAGGLSKHSLPVRVRGDQLIVRVEKSVYAQEVRLLAGEILGRVGQLVANDLKRLRVEQGTIDWSRGLAADVAGEAQTAKVELNEGQQKLLEGLRRLL